MLTETICIPHMFVSVDQFIPLLCLWYHVRCFLCFYNMNTDFDGHMFDVSAIKGQVSFYCRDWTVFVVSSYCDFCSLTWIRVVENKIPQITTWGDLPLGNTEHGGILEFFPCILNASDGTKCGILLSPGVTKALAKTHRPSQHEGDKEGDHTGVYLTLSDQTETKKQWEEHQR